MYFPPTNQIPTPEQSADIASARAHAAAVRAAEIAADTQRAADKRAQEIADAAALDTRLVVIAATTAQRQRRETVAPLMFVLDAIVTAIESNDTTALRALLNELR
jgi:hypothetical protein